MGKSKDELEVQNDGSSTPAESGSGGNVFLESCEHVASLNSKSQQDLSEKTFEKASERPVPQFLQGWRLYVVSIGLMLALFLSGLVCIPTKAQRIFDAVSIPLSHVRLEIEFADFYLLC